MKIENINGAGDVVCKCNSWLDHWDKFSEQSPTYCPVEECMNRIEVGAHVQKDSSADRAWYIVPLCQKHNAKKGESLRVNDNVKLVSADIKGTCG
ncbi:MAG TPA: hypothetical protein VIJ93_07660 [bacterium]